MTECPVYPAIGNGGNCTFMTKLVEDVLTAADEFHLMSILTMKLPVERAGIILWRT